MRVVVLGGGRSSEHEVSLASASSVLDGLDRAGHETVFVVIGRDGVWREGDGPRGLALTPGAGLLEADVVFPVLHGPFGEDGTVQGLLETVDVPYVGAGVLGSAVCMDKGVFKGLMANEGMPQVRYEVVTEREWNDREQATLDRLRGLGLPVFVKPSRLGSSVGISKVSEAGELADAVEAALAHDPRVLVEAAADGIEVECAVIGNDEPLASEPGQVIAHGDWYDYESKYTEGGMDLVVPAPVSGAQRERVRRIAQEAFVRSSCSGLARVDFFVTSRGQVLLNELNTIPGFTPTSVFSRLFEASGIGYEELLDRLLACALERHDRERTHTY
ncbi:MAG: D-alanine--D-alanine ligase family protein [Solirubrobacterales bacterium]